LTTTRGRDQETAPEEGPAVARAGPIDRLRSLIAEIFRLVAGDQRVMRIQAVFARNEEAGGALLSAGLAFHALFALLPALLLVAGLAGWLITDPATRAALVGDLVRRLPPLAGPFEEALDRLVSDRGTFTVFGLIGFAWGASNFYGSLDEAMARIFKGGRHRGIIERRIRGVVGVGALIGAALASLIAGSARAYVEATLRAGGDVAFWQVVGPALTAVAQIAAVLIVYRVVPTVPPGWKAVLLPGFVTGLAIALLTDVFTLLAPRLVGGLEAFGVLAALFGALIWLNFGFQLLLLGAAWAALRRDEPVPVSPPSDPGEIG
jgi:membrane protein